MSDTSPVLGGQRWSRRAVPLTRPARRLPGWPREVSTVLLERWERRMVRCRSALTVSKRWVKRTGCVAPNGGCSVQSGVTPHRWV